MTDICPRCGKPRVCVSKETACYNWNCYFHPGEREAKMTEIVTANPVMLMDIAEIEKERDILREEVQELEAAFDLRWNADIRAIRAWQSSTGRKMVWPNHADLVVWLMEELDKKGGLCVPVQEYDDDEDEAA